MIKIMKTLQYEVIDLCVTQKHQSWEWKEIRDYGVKLRANIVRNAYDDISHANIEMFSNREGWIIIASHPIAQYDVSKVSFISALTDEGRDLFADCANKLFKIGETFIGLHKKIN